MVKELKLSQGKVSLVDDDDFESLSKYKWAAMKTSTGKSELWYAVRNQRAIELDGHTNKRKLILLHRQIMSPNGGMVVDHINGNTLDNRKLNLRVCSQFENLQNVDYTKREGGKFIGVSQSTYKVKGETRWRARINVKGKNFAKDGFATPEEAALYRDYLARQLVENYVFLNFPEISEYPF